MGEAEQRARSAKGQRGGRRRRRRGRQTVPSETSAETEAEQEADAHADRGNDTAARKPEGGTGRKAKQPTESSPDSEKEANSRRHT